MSVHAAVGATVEAVIAGPDPGVYQDDNDTWLVTDGILIVIINKNRLDRHRIRKGLRWP